MSGEGEKLIHNALQRRELELVRLFARGRKEGTASVWRRFAVLCSPVCRLAAGVREALAAQLRASWGAIDKSERVLL